MTAWEQVLLQPTASAPPDHVARFVADAEERMARFLSDREDERVPAFVASSGHLVWDALRRISEDGLASGWTFCEWGSGIGLVTGLAALAGFDARGIEIESDLVEPSRDLLRSHAIEARIDEGSYLPTGAFTDEMEGERFAPADANVIYAFPWPAEEKVLERVFLRFAPRNSLFVTFHGGLNLRIRRNPYTVP
jgi:hypothetical protein